MMVRGKTTSNLLCTSSAPGIIDRIFEWNITLPFLPASKGSHLAVRSQEPPKRSRISYFVRKMLNFLCCLFHDDVLWIEVILCSEGSENAVVGMYIITSDVKMIVDAFNLWAL